MTNEHDPLAKALETLRIAQSALVFYALGENHQSSLVSKDGGEKATDALAKIDEVLGE